MGGELDVIMFLARALSRTDNPVAYGLSRIACRCFGAHTVYCRGRRDHARAGEHIDPRRWV